MNEKKMALLDILIINFTLYSLYWSYSTFLKMPPIVTKGYQRMWSVEVTVTFSNNSYFLQRTPPQTTQQQHQQHHQQQQQQPQHTTTHRVTAAPHKPLIQDRHVTGDASRKCNGLHALEKSPEIKKEEKSGPVSPFCSLVCFVGDRRSDVQCYD
ncbi:uncharacterized protein LOC135157452 [Lytechinus pictus]|uniref:uncharacterized protein LOC135157452 n=1 Tax=Lytechinus pictus TaxID=7653 RepID=UPI0030B9C74D